jgi:DNA replicative helicase MCM subunit Mcm2 (Cdc46/Mcm family)
MLTREAVELISNSRYVTAQNASGKGITAIIDKEKDTTILRLGAVHQARDTVCCINEIGRMDYEDQGFLLDVMEEGSFIFDKYAIHLKVKSATTIIATANPMGMKWNDPFKISKAGKQGKDTSFRYSIRQIRSDLWS